MNTSYYFSHNVNARNDEKIISLSTINISLILLNLDLHSVAPKYADEFIGCFDI